MNQTYVYIICVFDKFINDKVLIFPLKIENDPLPRTPKLIYISISSESSHKQLSILAECFFVYQTCLHSLDLL